MAGKKENIMRTIRIEKVILNCGDTAEDLEKAAKLIGIISGRKPIKIKSRRRIPALNVRPGLEVGTIVTLRGNEAETILKKLLGAVNNTIKEKSIAENSLTFGIPEYIEIPGIEYIREVGMRGLEVSIAFSRAGLRVKRKKIKTGKVPRRQFVSKEEIINFMKEKFNVEIVGKKGEAEEN